MENHSNGCLVYHVIRQVLVQIGQRVRIGTQALILTTESVACSYLSEKQFVIFPISFAPEFDKINHIECANVVSSACQMGCPISTLPEAEAVH